MAAKPPKKETAIDVTQVGHNKITACILGTSPLIFNAMSQKVKTGLLLPQKKSTAEKAATMKHNPPEEFLASCYRTASDDGPTRLIFPAPAFKAALASTATDIPGTARAQIARLTWVEGSYVDIFGLPQLLMSVVRSADMAKTPDIRTRAILPRWACRVSITYVTPLLREKAVITLLAAAGIMRGIGDWRPEKGSGNYGQFVLVEPTDKTFLDIMKSEGRAAQDKALAEQMPFDNESAELLAWWHKESRDRGFLKVA